MSFTESTLQSKVIIVTVLLPWSRFVPVGSRTPRPSTATEGTGPGGAGQFHEVRRFQIAGDPRITIAGW